jgi:hypothetical protein
MNASSRCVVPTPAGLAMRSRRFRPFRGTLRAVTSFLLAVFPIAVSAAGNGTAAYDGRVDFGSQVVRLDDGCVTVDGKISSGAFFDDLKRVEVGRQFEFTKHGRPVREYPASLTTSILIANGPCQSPASKLASSMFEGKSYALKFQVDWKEGMQLRPAALSPVEAHCTGYSAIGSAAQQAAVSSILCQLTVASKGVPLGDHLIVSIFGPDGTRVTRLSARP